MKNKSYLLWMILPVLIGVFVWAYADGLWRDDNADPQTLPQDEIDALVEKNRGINLKIGEKAPDFGLIIFGSKDKTMTLSEFDGQKAVIVNFWASWCSYCTLEMPLFEKVQQDYGDEVQVIGINLQEGYLDVLKGFVDGIGVTYPLLLDPDGEAKKAYRVIVQPQTFFIDKNGVLRAMHAGPLSVKQLLDKVHLITESETTVSST